MYRKILGNPRAYDDLCSTISQVTKLDSVWIRRSVSTEIRRKIKNDKMDQ